jgi:hypothetical protein
MAGPLRHRRDVEIDDALALRARRGQIDAIFVHRGAAIAHLLDQREQRRAERHQIAQRMPAAAAGIETFEEGLGRDVRLGRSCRRGPPSDRVRQRIEHGVGGLVAHGDEVFGRGSCGRPPAEFPRRPWRGAAAFRRILGG